MQYLKVYFLALFTFLLMDFVWLGFLAKNLYKEQIGFLMTKEIVWPAAIVFYFLYILGVSYFVIYPSLENFHLGKCFFRGALFGLICYATYDLTNLATIKGWPLKIVFIDLVWGAFITGVVSLVTSYYISKNL